MALIHEEETAARIAAWLIANRPASVPSSVPILVANRDEIRTRPCVVVASTDAKIEQPMRYTARMKLALHVFTQVDSTATDDHNAIAHALLELLSDPATLRADITDPNTFVLHDLRLKETTAEPDDTRGRETVLSFEATVSAL